MTYREQAKVSASQRLDWVLPLDLPAFSLASEAQRYSNSHYGNHSFHIKIY